MIGLVLLCYAWCAPAEAIDIRSLSGLRPRQAAPAVPVAHASDAEGNSPDRATPAAKRVRVAFAPGRSTIAVAGEARGYATTDYIVAANSPRRLAVRLVGANRYLVMAIFAPGGDAVCPGTCDREWAGHVSRSGDYTIRVGLVRAEARRQAHASYTLHIAIGP